ncbi:type II toxin-antitoxin system PemK/MazF family toxin [Dyadobacter sp. OTU695]
MQRGEIFWAKLDPVVGSEIAKTRPVLCIIYPTPPATPVYSNSGYTFR